MYISVLLIVSAKIRETGVIPLTFAESRIFSIRYGFD